jgi:rod shape-determining protein MreC
MRRNNTRKIVLLGLLVILLLTLMNYTKFGRVGVSPLESAVRDLFAPLQGLTMNVGHRLRGLVSFPFTLVKAADENQLMKKKITDLEGSLRQYEELKSENERLKKLLDFKSGVAPAMGYELVTAAIIGRSPENWFGVVTINRGSGDGIRPNMVVLNSQGLIGRVTSVSSSTAEVLLITDPRSGVAAMIQDSRTPGMVEGVASSPGRVRMLHIPIGAEINHGQVVVTSGLGSLYPKGIPIGWILEADRESSGLFSSAVVSPYVDFNRLEEVMVITGTRAPLAPPKVAELPSPWGESRAEQRDRSTGALKAIERNGVVVR